MLFTLFGVRLSPLGKSKPLHCPPAMFNPEDLSLDDETRLTRARDDRFRSFFDLTPDETIYVQPECFLVISGGPRVANLNIKMVHAIAWMMFGVPSVSLYSENTRIYKGIVPWEISCQALADLESGVSASAEVDDMATATLDRTLDVAETQTPIQQTVPVIKSLRMISDKTGISEEAIANQMLSLGLNVFRDGAGYKAPEADLEKWADRWSLQFARKQREWLLREEAEASAEPATNGKVEAESVEVADFTTGEEPTLIEAPETTGEQSNLPNLRFTPRKPTPAEGYTAKAFKVTLENALTALAKGADEQLVLCAAIAKPEGNELGTAALEKVVSIYGDKLKTKGDKIRKGITTAAIQLMSEWKSPEPAVTT